jgi:glycosyltransferase involved in cell wall biosynthesis
VENDLSVHADADSERLALPEDGREMRPEARVPIHCDGLIFALQKHGGIHRVTRNLIIALQERTDVQPHVYLPREPQADMGWLPAERTTQASRPMSLRPSRIFSRVNRSLAERATDRIWSDVERGVFLATYYSTYPGLRVPQVSMVHDMIFELFPDLTLSAQQERHKRERRASIESARAIICPSESARHDLEALFDVGEKTVRVIPYGVEEQYHPVTEHNAIDAFIQRATGGAPYLLHVGGREGTKNFVPLMMAFSRWQRNREIHLLTVGGGPFTNQENALRRALRTRENVHCIPSLSNEDLILAYNGAIGCVVPSLYEGYGFPVLESLACGTPVAASNVSSLPEVGGEVAAYFDPTDNDSIIEGIDQLPSYHADSHRVQSGIAWARRFTWDRCAAEVANLAKDIAVA